MSLPGARLTAARYIADILEPHVMPYTIFVGENFLFMHDNARPCTARIVQNYLNEIELPVLKWPARSPDLNPIENLWGFLKQGLRRQRCAFLRLEELYAGLAVKWENVPQNYILGLIESMPRRMQAVICAKGGNTLY